jgi:hypothetical protein
MNMSIKPSIPLPPSLAAHAVKEVQHALDAAAVKAVIGKGAEALGAMQLTSLAAFQELAGMHQGREPVARQARPQQSQPNIATPGQRGTTTTARGTSRPRSPLGSQPSAGGKLEQDEDDVLGREAGNVLKRLRNGDQSGLEQNLSEQYDPLERYRILQEALKQLDEEARSDEDKAPPRRQIKRLLGELDKENGQAIREGLEATGDMHALLQSLGEASVTAVRGWFGTAAQGKNHAPLTPVDLAVRLKETFGAGQFSGALSRLGQAVSRQLSGRRHRVAGEPPLMALTDARAFVAVRSCHAKAQELMRELAEINVSVRGRQGPVELAITLMRMAGGGKDQAVNLTGSIVDWEKMPPRRQSRVWAILRKVVLELPPSLWPQDAGVKAAVMAEFSDRLREQDAMVPRAAVTPASKREAELREQNAGRMTGNRGKA